MVLSWLKASAILLHSDIANILEVISQVQPLVTFSIANTLNKYLTTLNTALFMHITLVKPNIAATGP